MVNMQAALAQACREGDCAVVERMAALVDVNFARGQALYEAVRHGHTVVAKVLIERGANAAARGALFVKMAALSGNVELLRLLLEHAAHACSDTELGYALRMAAARGHMQVLQLLVERGMYVASCSGAALQVAAQNGHADVVCMLLDLNADATARDHRALRLAAG
jgi:ankyrin repeat protein